MFFLEVAAALSHYVSTRCVSVVIMPVCLCLAVLFSLSPSLFCLSLFLPRRMRSFMSTTPLRHPLHISRAPGEGNVAFLRGATQTEQSLQESEKKRNKQQTNEMGSRDHVKYIGLEGQFMSHCLVYCNIECYTFLCRFQWKDKRYTNVYGYSYIKIRKHANTEMCLCTCII